MHEVGRELRRLIGRPAATKPAAEKTPNATRDSDAAPAPDPAPVPPARSAGIAGTPLPLSQWRPAGVNLIGYARGELGIGEDLRTAARALDTQGVDFGIVNITRGLGARQKDHSVDRWLAQSPEYRINLFCVSGVEMFNVFLELGHEAFDGRYNIGYWPWELPHWPDECMPAFYFVDEVWSSTQFIVDALRPRAPVPVRRMPLAVTVTRRQRFDRKHFRLPKDSFLFLFTFDFNSFITRKNPFASLAAFRAAFAEGDRTVGLVVKVMNTRDADPNWRRFKALAEADTRIAIIDCTLSYDEIIGLMEVCDAYVSLHRSEGFGRGPAEAMLLGKPVIVTDYSGTRDFCHAGNACPVDYNLVAVGPDDYLFPAGQVWAEPDIHHAAEHMRRLVDDPEFARSRGAAAKAHIETYHSPEAVGRTYAARLAQLGLI